MPQPLMAQCAGSLAAHGHRATVLDDGTVDAFAPVVDANLSAALIELSERDAPPDRRWAPRLRRAWRQQERMVTACMERRVARALRLGSADGARPQVTILFAQRRKDVRELQQLARALRSQFPDLCIAIAGTMAVQYGRHIMTHCPEIDVACVAVPESSIPSLAARWDDPQSWRRIPGLLSRAPGGLVEAAWSVPAPVHAPPDYHPRTYPALRENGKFNLFTLTQSRGYRHAGHYRDGRHGDVQVRSARQLRREMVALHELFGVQAFHISGAQTPVDSILDFARECVTLPFQVTYSRNLDILEALNLSVPVLAASGCRSVGFSLLTGSQMTLTDYFGEGWTIGDATACLRACRREGLHVHVDLVYPVPVDDYHTRAETLRLLRRGEPDSVRIHLPRLVPGSAWYQHAAEFDFSMRASRFSSWTRAGALGMNMLQEASRLPWTIAGHAGSEAIRRLEHLYKAMEDCPAPVESNARMGLIAGLLREAETPARFAARLERAAKVLDLDTLRQCVDVFNARATASINTVAGRPTQDPRKAVGNS